PFTARKSAPIITMRSRSTVTASRKNWRKRCSSCAATGPATSPGRYSPSMVVSMPPASDCRRCGAPGATDKARPSRAPPSIFFDSLRCRSVTLMAQSLRLSRRGDGPAPLTTPKPNTGSGEFRVMSGMLINLIIQIVAGAVGGNVAGGAAKNIDLGTIGNTIAGAIGGGAGGQLLGMLIPLLANSASTPDIGAIIGQAAGGRVAGAVLTAIV